MSPIPGSDPTPRFAQIGRRRSPPSTRATRRRRTRSCQIDAQSPPARARPSLPGKRWIAGRLAETHLRQLGRIGRCDPRRVEVAQAALGSSVDPAERLLHGHLLVEHEPDQKRVRVFGDQLVRLAVTGEREMVGGHGKASWTHGMRPRHPRHRRRLRISRCPAPLPLPTPTRPLAIRAGNLLDVEAGRLVGPRTHPRARCAGRGGRRTGRRHTGRRARSSISGDLTVLPGLIDTHSHLVGDVQTAGVPGDDDLGRPGRVPDRGAPRPR